MWGRASNSACWSLSRAGSSPAETMAPKASTVRKLRKVAGGFAVRAVERVYRGLCSACAAGKS